MWGRREEGWQQAVGWLHVGLVGFHICVNGQWSKFRNRQIDQYHHLAQKVVKYGRMCRCGSWGGNVMRFNPSITRHKRGNSLQSHFQW